MRSYLRIITAYLRLRNTPTYLLTYYRAKIRFDKFLHTSLTASMMAVRDADTSAAAAARDVSRRRFTAVISGVGSRRNRH